MMRSLTVTFLILVFAFSVASADQIANVPSDKYLGIPSYLGDKPNEFVIVLKDNVPISHAKDAATAVALSDRAGFAELAMAVKAEKIRPQFKGADRSPIQGASELAKYYKVRFDASVMSLDDAMAEYAAHPDIADVQPIGIHAMYATPNDGYYDPYQWYHNQANDDDIDSPEAWDIQTGSTSVILAILDSGTRYYHPDLGGVNASPTTEDASRGNMWINDAELNGSAGVDDDGNGYIDDWIGYDFTDGVSNCWSGEDCNTKDNDPRDFNGHGTHTAGIMGMLTNDGYGMAGVAGGWGNGSQAVTGNGCKIMVCRMGYSYNYFGQEYGVVMMDAAAEAFYYAADNGAKIASCSWGSSNSGGIGAAATYFINAGGLIFVASGNAGDEDPGYLNSRSDCISVAATDQNDAAASFTTYGTWVDISAPGVGIYSTYHDHADPNTNYWASIDGTSMACPMAAATGAMIWSQNPGWTAAQVEAQLYASAENIDAELAAKYIGKMGAGRINLYDAVNTGTPPPVANFSGSPTSGCAPLAVTFTDASTGEITSWSWTFGDGGTSTAQNPSNTYNSPGTYTVALTVTGPGGSDTNTKNGYITVDGGPTAGFVGSPTSGTEPLLVNFTDQSSGATSWSWAFGDGGTSTAQNPSYTYNTAGTYTVTQTVTNACGSDQLVRTDYITVNPCVTPIAGFVGSPTSGDYPLTVDFTDQSTNASSYSWDFGDGGTSTAANPSYTYTAAGVYTVTQTVTNACGSDQLVRTNYITVTEPVCDPPVADFSGTPTTGTEPLTVDFTDLSTNSPTSWSWTFGDGGTSTAQNPTYVYNAAGTYTVTMTATNVCGSDVATMVDYITVNPSTSSKARAQSDISVLGTYSGSYLNTYSSDNSYEVITEALSTSHPVKETSHAEHKWNFNVGSGGSGMTFYVEAYRPNNSDGDNFIFEYSTDDATYLGMITVASATEQVYSFSMPPGLTGTVYVRVYDSNRSWDLISLDAIYIDDMYIEYSTTPTPPTADFVGTPKSGYYPLIVNFTDLSTGSPTSWSWTFGDGGTSTAQNPSYTYAAVGTYTVSLTATNSYGSDTDTETNYITVTEPGSGESHVNSMVIGRVRSGSSYSGTCTVTIFDETNAPLANATVFVTYDGPNNGSLNGVTAGDGTVDFTTPLFKKPVGEWCFEVTDVTHATHTYDAASNVVTRACESGPVAKNGCGDALPTSFALDQNYPNPFNPSTSISFALPKAGHATIEIYNVLGKKVDVLADGQFSAGYHNVVWDGTKQASGIYFYRLSTRDFTESKKMLLIK